MELSEPSSELSAGKPEALKAFNDGLRTLVVTVELAGGADKVEVNAALVILAGLSACQQLQGVDKRTVVQLLFPQLLFFALALHNLVLIQQSFLLVFPQKSLELSAALIQSHQLLFQYCTLFVQLSLITSIDPPPLV